MRKICVVVTARPSYSRIKSVLSAIHKNVNLELRIIASASALLERYGMVCEQMTKDGFEVNHKVFTVLEGDSPEIMAKTTGLAIIELSSIFKEMKPDAIVTIADRYETLGTAIAASYLGIPLIHMQGGEVTGSIDERVRHAITKLADYHFVCSEQARNNVVKMGEHESNVFLTGCPSIDLAVPVLNKKNLSFNPFDKYLGVGPIFDINKGYVVIQQHPVTTEYEEAGRQTSILLEAITSLNIQAMWFWPNVDAGSDDVSRRLRRFREKVPDYPIHFFKNFASTDFLELIMSSQCLVGNSSVGIRECSFLGIPVVNIGSRQEGRERGKNVYDCDYDTNEIKENIMKSIEHGFFESTSLYGDGFAGQKISKILETIELGIERREKRLSY